jgi:DNA-directed RNA polymerase subunit RPC12/RpoP
MSANEPTWRVWKETMNELLIQIGMWFLGIGGFCHIEVYNDASGSVRRVDASREANRKCSVCGALVCGFHGRAKPNYKDVKCPDCREKKR